MHQVDSSYGVQGLLSMQPPSTLLAISFQMNRVSIAETGVFCLKMSSPIHPVFIDMPVTKYYPAAMLVTFASRLPKKVFIL